MFPFIWFVWSRDNWMLVLLSRWWHNSRLHPLPCHSNLTLRSFDISPFPINYKGLCIWPSTCTGLLYSLAFFLGQDSQINLGHNIHIYRMDSNRFVAKRGFVVLLSALVVKVIMIDNTHFLLVKFTLIP